MPRSVRLSFTEPPTPFTILRATNQPEASHSRNRMQGNTATALTITNSALGKSPTSTCARSPLTLSTLPKLPFDDPVPSLLDTSPSANKSADSLPFPLFTSSTMAEVLGTTAGVVSLGIQLCDTITQYVEDFNTRDEQLGAVLRRAQRLKQSLEFLDQITRDYAPTHPAASQAISTNIAACETELKALHDFAYELVPSVPPTDRKGKMKETAKRLIFPFNRADIDKLDARFDKASAALSLAINCLQLYSQAGISSGQATMQSDLSKLNDRFDEMFVMFRSWNSMSPHQRGTEVMTMALTKPSALKDVCDIVTDARSSSESQNSITETATMAQDGGMSVQQYQFRKSPKSCGCRPRRYKYSRMSPSWFSFSVLEEIDEERVHHPSCEMSEWNLGKRHHSIALTYTGLRDYLSRAVSVGFFMSNGAGGCSIAPLLRTWRTVNENTSPAFVLMDRIRIAMMFLTKGSESAKMLVVDRGLSALRKIFAAKKAFPADVDQHGYTLMTRICQEPGGLGIMLNSGVWRVLLRLIDLEIPTQGVGLSR